MAVLGRSKQRVEEDYNPLYESVLSDAGQYGEFNPFAEPYRESGMSAFTGGLSGGIFGTPPEQTQGFTNKALSFGGMLGQEVTATALTSLLVPPAAGAKTAASIGRLTKYLPNAVTRAGLPNLLARGGGRNILSPESASGLARWSMIGAGTGVSSSILNETDPIKTIGAFAVLEGGGFVAGNELFKMFRSVKAAKNAATDTVEEGVQSVEELAENSKVLSGEKEFKPEYREFVEGAKSEAREIFEARKKKTKAVSDKIKSVNKTFNELEEAAQKRPSTKELKLKDQSDNIGFREAKPGSKAIIDGAGYSNRKVREAIDDLDGLTPEEAQIFMQRSGSTELISPRGIQRIVTRRSDIQSPNEPFIAPNERLSAEYRRFQQPVNAPDEVGAITSRGTFRGRGSQVPKSRIDEIERRVAQMNDDLYLANLKTQLGMKLDSSLDDVQKQIEKVEARLIKEESEYLKPTQKEMALQERLDKELNDLAKLGFRDIDPKLADTVDYAVFERKVGRFIDDIRGDNGDELQRSSLLEAEQELEKASKVMRDNDRTYHEGLKKQLSDFKPKVRREAKSVDDLLQSVGSADELPPVSTETEKAMLTYMAQRIDNLDDNLFPRQVVNEVQQVGQRAINPDGSLNPAAASDLENLQQIQMELLLKDRATLDSMIEASNDDALRKAYYIYRASQGEQDALLKAKAIQQGQAGKLKTELDGQQAEQEVYMLYDSEPQVARDSVPPPQEPPTPSVRGQFEELQTRPRDLDPFSKHLRSFDKIAQSFAKAVSGNATLRPIAEKLRGMRKMWQDSYQLARRDFVDINRRIDEFLAETLKPDTDTGKISLDFIKSVDDTLESVRNVTKKNFNDQSPATQSLYNRMKDLTKQGLKQEEALEKIELDMVAKQTPEVQNIYKEYRKFDNEVLEKYNAFVKQVNRKVDGGEFPESFRMKEVNKIAGHAPIIYDGDLMIRIVQKNADGTKILYADSVYGRQEAFDSISKWINQEKNAYGKVPGEIQIIPKYLSDDPDLNSLASISDDASALFGQDAGFIDEAIAKKEFRPDNLHEVFFAGAKPRILNQTQKRIGVVKALRLRAFMANKSAHFSIPRLETELIAKSLDQQGYPKYAKYLRTYADDQIGKSRGLEKTIDEAVSAVVERAFDTPASRRPLLAMGITPNGRNTRSLVRGLTFMGRAGALGINIGTAFINQLLFATNVAPLVGFRHASKAMLNVNKIFQKDSVYQPIFNKLGIRLTSGGLGHMENLAQTTGAYGTNLGKYTDWVDGKLMWAFNQSEDLTRGASAIAFREQAEDFAKQIAKGKMPNNWKAKRLKEISEKLGKSIDHDDVLNEYAVEMVWDTNFIFDLTDAPELFRSVPLKPFLQFKNFFVKELEFMFDMGSKSPKDLFKVLGAFAALGGTFGLPGIKEVDAISRFSTGFSPMLWAEENLPEVAVVGLPVLGGADISGRVNFGELSFVFQNPAGIFLNKMGAGFNYYKNGELDKARAVLTPNGLRGLMQSYEIATTGRSSNPFYRGTDVLEHSSGIGKFFAATTTLPTKEQAYYMRARTYKRQQVERIKRIRTRAMNDAKHYFKNGERFKGRKRLKEAGVDMSTFNTWMKGENQGMIEYIEDTTPYKDNLESFFELNERKLQ